MSRQSKQAKKKLVAAMFKGSNGPAKTQPKHGKDPAKRVYTARCRSLAEFQDRNKKAGVKTARAF